MDQSLFPLLVRTFHAGVNTLKRTLVRSKQPKTHFLRWSLCASNQILIRFASGVNKDWPWSEPTTGNKHPFELHESQLLCIIVKMRPSVLQTLLLHVLKLLLICCFLLSNAAFSMLWVRRRRASGLIQLVAAFADAVPKLENHVVEPVLYELLSTFKAVLHFQQQHKYAQQKRSTQDFQSLFFRGLCFVLPSILSVQWEYGLSPTWFGLRINVHLQKKHNVKWTAQNKKSQFFISTKQVDQRTCVNKP